MRISPACWGPLIWNSVHIIALAYPEKPTYADKKAAKEFFEALQYLLPCPMCRGHLKTHLIKHPITPHLDRRDDLFKWTVMLHNEVNVSLKKSTFTEVEALLYLKRIGARETSPIINSDMINEIDMRSMMKGGFMGAGIMFTAGLAIYYFSKTDGR